MANNLFGKFVIKSFSMKISHRSLEFLFIIVFVHLIKQGNCGNDTSSGGGGNGSLSRNPSVIRGWDNPRAKANYTELILPDSAITEDPAIEEEVQKLELSHCDLIFIHCIDHISNQHRHINPARLESRCLKQTKGYLICVKYTQEDAVKAKENAEKENATTPGGEELPPS